MEEMERIKFAIAEWRGKEIRNLQEREVDLKFFTETDHIIDVIGPRRAGKTYLCYLIAKKLEQNFPPEAILYINFENKRLFPLGEKLLDALLEKALSTKSAKNFLFLDEIQNVKGWERWARNIYDNYKGKIKIVVSGSSSRIIAKSIAGILTGRHLSIRVFPLGFKEFLAFKKFMPTLPELYSPPMQAEMKSLLQEFVHFGSFPEVSLQENSSLKEEILKGYYDDILYKDIMDKYGIREKIVLENFMKFLFINISGYFSYRRAQEYLQLLGIPTSTRTLLRYASILEEVFLFFFVPIFSRKMRDQAKYPKKMYCVDVGLRNVVYSSNEDWGIKAENMVFLELKRRQKMEEINYWKSSKQEEVDFLIRNGLKIKELIQVCWDISLPKTKEREIKALLLASKELKCNNLKVVTYDYGAVEIYENKKIEFVPLWQWLLG